MNQGSEFVTQQESTPAFQDQGSRIIPPKKVLRRFVHTKIPKLIVSLPLSLIPQKPEKKPIDYVLTRLASMDLPGKVHVEDYLRHQYRRNFKLNTMRSTLAGCELFLSFLKDQGKTELKQINRQDLEGFVGCTRGCTRDVIDKLYKLYKPYGENNDDRWEIGLKRAKGLMGRANGVTVRY